MLKTTLISQTDRYQYGQFACSASEWAVNYQGTAIRLWSRTRFQSLLEFV